MKKQVVKLLSLTLLSTFALTACNSEARSSGASRTENSNMNITVSQTNKSVVLSQNTLPKVDQQYVSSMDQNYIDRLSAEIRRATRVSGQGGGGIGDIYIIYPWQIPGIIEILIDTQQNYYQHDVENMLTNELRFNDPNYFKTNTPDITKFDNNVDNNNLITQLLWEEYGCKSASPSECQFTKERSDLIYKGINLVNTNKSFGQMSVINDDRQWWALAFLTIYQQNPQKYAHMLEASKRIRDIVSKYRQTQDGHNNGGICWAPTGKYTINSDGSCYVNTITNSLYLTLNARLAETVGVQDPSYSTYIHDAQKIADLLITDKPIGDLYGDEVGSFMHNHDNGLWTYNQGVFLDGLATLTNLTGDPKYLNAAKNAITNTLAVMLDSNGILRELNPSEKNGMFFRAAFFDHLSKFLEKINLSQDPEFTKSIYRFLRHNANNVNISCAVDMIQSNYDIYHTSKDSANNNSCTNSFLNFTYAYSNQATQSAALSLKTTYLRLRTWIANHPEVDYLDVNSSIASTQFKCNTSNKLRFVADDPSKLEGVYLVNTQKFYDVNSMNDVDAPDLCKYAGDGVVRRYTVEVRYKAGENKFFNIGSYTWDNKDSKTNIGLDQLNGSAVNLSTTDDQEYLINNARYRLDGGGYDKTPRDGKAGVFIRLK